MSIVSYDVQSLVDQWMEAEQNGEQFPVDTKDRFTILMSALAYANEFSRKAKMIKEFIELRRFIDKVGFIRRNTALSSESEHLILVEMIDSVSTSLQFHNNLLKDKYDSGCVYFLLNKLNNQVKIGWTVKLSERTQTLCNQSGMDLVLLGFFIAQSQSAESEMHKKFSHLRKKGEWFEYKGDLKEFISEKF